MVGRMFPTMQASAPSTRVPAGDTLSSIPAGLDAVDAQSAAVGELLDRLVHRLGPALCHVPPQPLGADIASVAPVRCEISERLFAAVRGLEAHRLLLEDVLSRIEL